MAAMAAGAIQKGSISFGPVNIILIWVFTARQMRALAPRHLDKGEVNRGGLG
jgi:hypothetical protein